MADHLRHLLAREGAAVRPSSIQTIASFLDTWSPLGDPPAALVNLSMERALSRQRPLRFRAVLEYPGVVRALVELFARVSGTRLPEDISRLFAEVEKELAASGFAPRHVRLETAAARIELENQPLPASILWHGFFTLSAGELSLVSGLAQKSDLAISLPDWPGAERTREVLRAKSFDELQIDPEKRSVKTSLFRAATIEREVEEMARQVLEAANKGRAFHEIGVVLRSRDPYGPIVASTLARFGIPARSYFIDTLASHPTIVFLSTLVRAALADWDQELVLRALRMPASGLGATKAGDELDLSMREKLAAKGWHETLGLNSRERLVSTEWAQRVRGLRKWTPPVEVQDRTGHDRVQAWRSVALALAGWDAALETTAAAFGSERVTLAKFWKQVETVLSLEQMRIPDTRRNVVHVLDAYEARQWSLPIVFVCGMTERHFPKYHREDPIVGDAALRRAGLDTATDREREERFLFEVATSRATVETVLSYPRFDEAGQNTLASFFLPDLPVKDVETTVLPSPKREVAVPVRSRLQDAGLAERHRKLSASAIEFYLQCPFKFFAMKTLRLEERPDAPRDRLNFLVQGSILHEALAEWTRSPLLGDAALEEAFERHCSDEHVPRTYRTEAVRLELLRHFQAFTRDAQVNLKGWKTRVEEKFEFALNGGLTLRGRIDRMDVDSRDRVLVVDYKYSAAGKLKERIESSASGDAVQAGVYLMAAARHFKMKPAGMLFCHVKNGVNWDGWHFELTDLGDVGTARPEAAFAELMQNAEQTVLRVHDEIVTGCIDVAPADQSKCAWCECRDICRVETIARVKEAGA
jgi:ATP-dependent helicase/DNAse subunit B